MRLMFSRMKFIMIFLPFVCDQLIIQKYKECNELHRAMVYFITLYNEIW